LSIFFYTIFLWIYQTAIGIASMWNPKARLFVKGRKNTLQQIKKIALDDQQPVLWMHCASLGEFEQGRPVIERFKKNNASYKVVLTFFSPSGYEIRKNYQGADYVFYLPFDSKKNAKLFIDAIHPRIVLWVKYDYWFYYLNALKKRNIPTLLISGIFRPDQSFFKWYGRLHRYMLGCFTHLFVQTEDSQKLLHSIGISNQVTLTGDTRFDRVVEISEQFDSIPSVEKFCTNEKVIVAGSTWREDEEELDHYANAHPHIKFIIAPHEIDEIHLKDIENLFHESIRFSVLDRMMVDGRWPMTLTNGHRTANNDKPVPHVLIIDNIGMLSRLYKYATIAYVGGGFGDDGVHNVLEAAVYSKPVVFGPVIEKYFEAIELVESGGGIVIDSALEAEGVFNRLFASDEEYRFCCRASGDYVHAKTGASQKIIQFIQENLLFTS